MANFESSFNNDSYDENERFVSSSKINEDDVVENILRPKTFDEYVGQKQVKENLPKSLWLLRTVTASCLSATTLSKPKILNLLSNNKGGVARPFLV